MTLKCKIDNEKGSKLCDMIANQVSRLLLGLTATKAKWGLVWIVK